LERAKRILIIADPRSPLAADRGLVGCKGGYHIYWFSAHKAELKGVAGAIAPPLGHLKWLSRFWSPFFLWRFLNHIHPDLIHVFFANQQADTMILSRFRPLVLTVMGGDVLPDQSFNGRRKWWIKKMLDSADVITSKSIFLDSAINQIGSYGHKIRRVTWGVDTKRFRPGVEVEYLRQQWNIHPDNIVFLCPRISQPFYNKHLIIQAFANYIHRSGPVKKARLIVAELFAEKAYSERLRALAKELGLMEHVRFVGAIPHEEMPAYLNLSDIMIAIPSSDGMPQCLYEAMACGTYPILGDLLQYRELIQDGSNGRLVAVGDVGALSEAMQWATDHLDHRRIAAQVNRHRILQIADKNEQDRIIISIYEELLQKYDQ
jgi:glycosyltransferase involved in cell wall biosynthesis